MKPSYAYFDGNSARIKFVQCCEYLTVGHPVLCNVDGHTCTDEDSSACHIIKTLLSPFSLMHTVRSSAVVNKMCVRCACAFNLVACLPSESSLRPSGAERVLD